MAQSRRYVRSVWWHLKLPTAVRPLTPPPAARLAPGLVIALWVSGFLTLATLLSLARSWILDAPASEADLMVGFGVGGLTWLMSLGYYALWQLDKQSGPVVVRKAPSVPRDEGGTNRRD